MSTAREIITSHPELFGRAPFDPKKTLIAFGFEVSEYWLPVLEKGFDDIAEIVKEQGLIDFRITQVKEKFGSLRIYCMYYTDEIDEVIDRMEEEAETICESCGAPGKLRTDGWMVVRCDKCQANWFEKQYEKESHEEEKEEEENQSG